MDVFIARQPIFDNDYKLFAYELLYRDSLNNFFGGELADNVATSILLVNSFINFGIENLVGDNKAFINFDKRLIGQGIAELLDQDHVVVELLETVEPDYLFIKKVTHLKKKGYTIALDDYTLAYPHQNIVDLADIIKVDFVANSKEDIIKLIQPLKASGKKLLAEKVEKKEEFEWAKSLGFDYYQGYYFAKPSVQKKKTLNSNGLQYIKLMGELNLPEPDFKTLSNIILVDVSLTYKLLKLVNSNSKLMNTINSVQQAIAVLGIKSFKKWLTLAMVQQMSGNETHELVKYALIRSSLLSMIAEHSKMKKYEEELSLMGTLSIIDAILEMDMKDALLSIPISLELKDTLMGEKTMYSDAMELCLAYEKGRFDTAEIASVNIGYDLNLLPEHYVKAISWAEKIFKELREEK